MKTPESILSTLNQISGNDGSNYKTKPVAFAGAVLVAVAAFVSLATVQPPSSLSRHMAQVVATV